MSPEVLKTHVGKKFTNKQTGDEFAVAEFLPKFDYGARRGGCKDSYRIVRLGHDTESIQSADGFLAAHSPVMVTETVAVTETVTTDKTIEVEATAS